MDQLAQRLDRRHALRLIGASALVLPTAFRARPAGAARLWCRTDPDVLLEGTFVKVNVAVAEEYLHLVNGPTWLRFNLPSAVDRELVWADSGFNGLGYDVTFSTAYQPNKRVSKFSVNLSIKVPIVDGTKVPIWAEAIPAQGTYVAREGNDANTGTSLNFTVHGSL